MFCNRLNGKIEQLEIAENHYKKILEENPRLETFKELLQIYLQTNQLSKAAQYLVRAVKLFPDSVDLQSMLGMVMIQSGQTKQGVDQLKQAVKNAPQNPAIHSSLLWYLQCLPELDLEMIFDERKKWTDIYAPPGLAQISHENTPEPDRKIRVGYISPDFYNHSIDNFFEPLLHAHDHHKFEVYGFGNVARPDDTTERLKQKFDQYRNIYGADSQAVAGMIENDKIDILVALAGHTAGNRLEVLAYKPAPIQVAYLELSTSAMPQIDYRLTDSFTSPPELQKFYTEQAVYLATGEFCYAPPDCAPDISPLPALKNGYITFGSFNNNFKIHPQIISIWAKMLKANPQSKLIMDFKAGDDPDIKERYLCQFKQLQVEPQRITIGGWKPLAEHLSQYKKIDIALDTYPFNGCATTCHALWMGVPTLSLTGDAYVSRAGLSILNTVGLGIFASPTPDELVAKSTAFANQPQHLAKIRISLRQMMAESNLCNAKAFAAGVENEYQKMWYKWCEIQYCRMGS